MPRSHVDLAERKRMTTKEVKQVYSVLEPRERLVVMLATTGGMRPGEIFALQWKHVRQDHIEIRQRVYRGVVDSPKTRHSVRRVALSDQLRTEFRDWKAMSLDPDPEAWVFPSENPSSPIRRDNCWRRNIAPRLHKAGLGWVNFQVMRRTHSSLMRKLDVDPKIVADQLGHTLDVNLNVYTKTPLHQRRQALNTLEFALNKSLME